MVERWVSVGKHFGFAGSGGIVVVVCLGDAGKSWFPAWLCLPGRSACAPSPSRPPIPSRRWHSVHITAAAAPADSPFEARAAASWVTRIDQEFSVLQLLEELCLAWSFTTPCSSARRHPCRASALPWRRLGSLCGAEAIGMRDPVENCVSDRRVDQTLSIVSTYSSTVAKVRCSSPGRTGAKRGSVRQGQLANWNFDAIRFPRGSVT